MAETYVSFLLVKLEGEVFQKAVSRCKVDGNVKWLKDELLQLLQFLRNAYCKSGKVNEVLYRIEDTIDIFLLEVDTLSQRSPSLLTKFSTVIKWKIAARRFVYEIEHIRREIEIIKSDLIGAASAPDKPSILGEGTGTSISVPAKPRICVPVKRPILPSLEDTKLLGVRADDKKNIIGDLLDKSTVRSSVVSIVGLGGLGKTTLAQKLYTSDDIKNEFEVRMWVVMSQKSELTDLLKKMLQNIRFIQDHERNKGKEYFSQELYQTLRTKKYLVVLDDVRSDDLLPQIKAALPDVGNGSRVLITSRFSSVISDKIYQLRKLNDSESLDLLKTVLCSGDSSCPPYLKDIPKKLADRCDGLPLSLVVLGGLLSVKPVKRDVWAEVLKILVSSVEKDQLMNVLATSYNDMHADLKICFMYLAFFPKDCAINARVLVRLWIAEGFIPQNSGNSPEDTAECYLKELVQRNMVIVLRSSYDNSVRTILVHNILHDFAIEKARYNLITVLSEEHGTMISTPSARRLAIWNLDHNYLESIDPYPKIRSLNCFNVQYLPNFSKHNLLKVVNLEGANCGNDEMVFKRSTQLRFLRLGELPVFCRNLKGLLSLLSKGQLKHLETLDLRTSEALKGKFPKDFWRIRTLRHVLLPKNWEVAGPPSWAVLENLQTLKFVKESDSWLPTQLPRMPNVRFLKLQVRSPSATLDKQKIITALLRTLSNLIALHLDLDVVSPIVTCHIVHMHYQNLENLTLVGQWDKLHQNMVFPPNLIKLQLLCSRLEEDLMPELGKLSRLKILTLYDAYKGEKMICPSGGFPSLEYLQLIHFKNLKELKIEEGAIGNLKLLKIVYCDELKLLPKHLTCRIEWDIY